MTTNIYSLLSMLVFALSPTSAYQSRLRYGNRDDEGIYLKRLHLEPFNVEICKPGEICIINKPKVNGILLKNLLRSDQDSDSRSSSASDESDSNSKTESDDIDSFRDLTRLESEYRDIDLKDIDPYGSEPGFSKDYIDLSDLQRQYAIKNYIKQKRNNKLHVNKANFEPKHKTYTVLRSGRKIATIIKKKAESESNEVSSSNSKSSSSSEETKQKEIKPEKIRSPKRFEVVASGKDSNNGYYQGDESSDTKSKESESKSEEVQQYKPPHHKVSKKQEPKVRDKKESVMQASGRILHLGKKNEEDDEYRRSRMQHFLPKRYHWDLEDYYKLGYFWFNGPQGNSPGNYRIKY